MIGGAVAVEPIQAVVRRAGQMALTCWPGHGPGHREALEVWEKAPGHPVCATDLEIDRFLKHELGQLVPQAGWLSEETADAPERLEGGLIWLVDPIDGTRDYIRGRTGWAVSVALISDGQPVLGLLYAPAAEQMWLARAGKGAARNGERLVASTRSSLPGARVPAKSTPGEDADLVLVEQPNSIALRIAKVAADEADLVATLRWGYEWDIGAAALIAAEAGATVTDAFGGPLSYNKRDPRAFGVLVSAPAIHAAAVDRLAERARRLAG